jgi:hypothetical protein
MKYELLIFIQIEQLSTHELRTSSDKKDKELGGKVLFCKWSVKCLLSVQVEQLSKSEAQEKEREEYLNKIEKRLLNGDANSLSLLKKNILLTNRLEHLEKEKATLMEGTPFAFDWLDGLIYELHAEKELVSASLKEALQFCEEQREVVEALKATLAKKAEMGNSAQVFAEGINVW